MNNEEFPEEDSFDIIYDELSSGEDYWGDSTVKEMLAFCRKRKLIFYITRLEKQINEEQRINNTGKEKNNSGCD